MAKRKRSSRFSIVPKKTTETTLLGEITEEDKLLAREVWMQVESNYIVISKALFSELFRVHPEYKDFFKDLIDIDSEEDDAWLNPRFERHMIHVLLPALGAVIRNVDRPEAIRDQMIKLGKVHKVKVVGLKKKHIETLKKLLLVTVKRCIGRGMRAEHELALFKIFSSSISIFEEALEEKVHENGIMSDTIALRCFVCESLEDNSCFNVKTDDTDSKFYKPCRLIGSTSMGACFKFTEERNKFVHRFCGGKQSKDGCWKDQRIKFNGTFCQCSADGCNNGQFICATSFLVLLFVVLTQCLLKY